MSELEYQDCMPSATDELRRLLDELGIGHYDNDLGMRVTGVRYTRWDNGGVREVRYEEWRNGTTRLDAGNVTPEQAIAATVDGTCRLVDNECGPNLHCTACGREVGDEYRYFMKGYYGYSRCPHCGRRIEVDE